MFLIMYNENDNEYVYINVIYFIYYIINLFKTLLYIISIVKKE